MVSFDLGTRRTQGNHDKDYSIVGLDSDGNEAFNLLVSAHSSTSEQERIAVVTGAGTTTTYDLIGTFGGIGTDATQDIPNTGGTPFSEDDIANIVLNLMEDEYTLSFTRENRAYVTGAIPYNEMVSDLAQIDFLFQGGGSDGVRTGFLLDNLAVKGYVLAIPEPATMALWFCGLLGFVAWHRKRRNR